MMVTRCIINIGSFVSLVKFNVNCAVTIFALCELNWRQFDRWRLSGKAILLTCVYLLHVFDLATIGCDLQMDWNWFLFIFKGGQEFVGGTTICSCLWHFLNIYFDILLFIFRFRKLGIFLLLNCKLIFEFFLR